MTHIFHQDFQEFIAALNEGEVRYLLVGGYAVILHGYTRTTGDLDIWVQPTLENYRNLVHAFHLFRMPLFDMTEERFLSPEFQDVFTFGRPPVCIDVVTQIKGLSFEAAYSRSQWFEIGPGLRARTLSLEDLITAKRAAGRHKDWDDIEHLKKE